MAKGRLGQQPGYPAAPQPGPPGGPQPGWAAEPQPGPPGGPQPGWAAEPRPGPPGGPQPGWAAEPQPGPPGQGGWRARTGLPGNLGMGGGSLEDDLTGVAMNAAARFIGRKIGRRVQDKLSQAMPAMAAKQEAMLREQIAIAERHPDLRACMTDHVVFLAGGSRVLPMAGLTGQLTLEQSDALVARLRDG